MAKRQVYLVKPRSELPANRGCVKSKWVFKIKCDGRFRARLVACGYSQTPGVDYTENYSPVINDVTFHLMILAMIYLTITQNSGCRNSIPSWRTRGEHIYGMSPRYARFRVLDKRTRMSGFIR